MTEEDQSILLQSARNLVQYIYTGLDELKKYAYDPAPVEDLSSYMMLLTACHQEYAAYKKRRRKRSLNRNQQLLIQTKLSRIPLQYFLEDYKLSLVRRSQANRKQQQLSQLLDETQIILFARVAKYPKSSTIILDNLAETDTILHQTLTKVRAVRFCIADKITIVLQKQARINKINAKIKRLNQLIEITLICKRIRNLKVAAASENDYLQSEQLLTIKKKQLEKSQTIVSLRRIVLNIQSYRSSIKDSVYAQFQKEVQVVINRLLQYSRQGMREKQEKQQQESMNITVLDQSDFVFDTKDSNIGSGINAYNYNVEKLTQLWAVMSKFDIYEQEQINQLLGRIFVRHAFAFTQDMQTYFTQVCGKVKNQSYATLKKTQNEDKVTLIPMRMFVRVVRFYFDILKRFLSFINNVTQLQFLSKFKCKFYQFIRARVKCFLEMKKITQQSAVQQFVAYVNLIQYWLMEQQYALHPSLQDLFQETVNEYLTALQTHGITKRLKQGLDSCNFLPVAINSSHYSAFNAIINQHSLAKVSDLRFIDTRLIVNHKEYRACDAFLLLVPTLQKYICLRDLLTEFITNINEKICEVVGFYAWYGHKVITHPKGPQRNLLNLCTFYSNLQLLHTIFALLQIQGNKSVKTQQQIYDCKEQIKKHINMTPYMMIEEQISLIYDHKQISKNAPLAESMQIIAIVRQTIASLKEIFPVEEFTAFKQSTLSILFQPCLKLINKNYFGYFISSDKRGSLQLKWFLPKLREALEITVFKQEKEVKNDSFLHCLYQNELKEMERTLKHKDK